MEIHKAYFAILFNFILHFKKMGQFHHRLQARIYYNILYIYNIIFITKFNMVVFQKDQKYNQQLN